MQGSSRRVLPTRPAEAARPLRPWCSGRFIPLQQRCPGRRVESLAQPLARLGAYWRQTRPTGGELGLRACPGGDRRAPAACPPRTPSMRRDVSGPPTPARASTRGWERRPGFAPRQQHLQAAEDCSIVPRGEGCCVCWGQGPEHVRAAGRPAEQ